MSKTLKAPFPYFGGKRKVADEIWRRFGDVANYVEPFFGSGAVLLGRPGEPTTETVNDADGLLCNFWRALQADPDAVAKFADWPVSECDLSARHAWLVGQKDSLQTRLEGDPDYHDAKIAGWWVWGIAAWIGTGFCSGKGPWHVQEVDGVKQLVKTEADGEGIARQLGYVMNAGCGINRKLVYLKGGGGNAPLPAHHDLHDYFQKLAARLRRVRVCCGDWSRVCGPSVTFKHGVTAVFLDPPYADIANRYKDVYRVDSEQVAHAVRDWAVERGNNPLMRICLAGYDTEHEMPDNWKVHKWNAGEGYGGQAEERSGNGKRETLWFSPACRDPEPRLFD